MHCAWASLNDSQPSCPNNRAVIAQVMSHGIPEGESQGQKWKVMDETAILDPHNRMGHWLMKVQWGPLIIHLWLAHLKSILRSQGWQGENVCVYVPEHFNRDLLKTFRISSGLFRTFSISLSLKSNILPGAQWITSLHKKSSMSLCIVLNFVDWDILFLWLLLSKTSWDLWFPLQLSTSYLYEHKQIPIF